MARELRKRDIVSVALTPGFLRSEAVLDVFKVTEANWKDVGKRKNKKKDENSKDQNDAPNDFMVSESPRYIGRAVAALATDPKVKNKSDASSAPGPSPANTDSPTSMALSPTGVIYARKKYGKYKICDRPILFLLGPRPH